MIDATTIVELMLHHKYKEKSWKGHDVWLELFLFSQADLVSTIGESAAMGTSGVVIWEKSETKTEVDLHKVHK